MATLDDIGCNIDGEIFVYKICSIRISNSVVSDKAAKISILDTERA